MEQLTSFRWDLDEKRSLLLEALQDLRSKAGKRYLSEMVELAIETYLMKSAKKLKQTDLSQFGAVDNSPSLTAKLTSADFEQFTEKECWAYAEAARSLSQQFDHFARKKAGITRTVRVSR